MKTVVLATWPSLHDVPGVGASVPVLVADALAAGLSALGDDTTLVLGGDHADPRVTSLAEKLRRDPSGLAADRAERALAAWQRFGVRTQRLERAGAAGDHPPSRARARLLAERVAALVPVGRIALVGRAVDLPTEAAALAFALEERGVPGPVHSVVADLSLFEGGACARTSGRGLGIEEAADVLPADAWRAWIFAAVSHQAPVEIDFRWEDLASDLKALLDAPVVDGAVPLRTATEEMQALRPCDAFRTLWPSRRRAEARGMLEAFLPAGAARLVAGDPFLRSADLFHSRLQLKYRDAAEARLQAMPFEEAVALAAIE